MRHQYLFAALLAGLLAIQTGVATPSFAQSDDDLTALSLEDLMGLEVTSVSKREERRSDAAAAIFVLTNDDLRRSGATTLPEALRLVPGVQVARINAHSWSVTARGFASEFSNKLLVLIDGRSVYTPLFSGVYWDVQNPRFEDIERIEVVRGPGGTVWGANAVNGVINVITKATEDTQGWNLVAGGGEEERRFGSIRYGGRHGDDGHWRVHASGFRRDNQRATDLGGQSRGDSSEILQGGFRYDGRLSEDDEFTIQGDFYDGHVDIATSSVQSIVPPVSTFAATESDVQGGNLLTRWDHTFEGGSQSTLQLYYDRTEREGNGLNEERDTWDLDFSHFTEITDSHRMTWGAGYRWSRDRTTAVLPGTSFSPRSRSTKLASAFFQLEWDVSESLRVIGGSKFEYNNLSGMEYQPSIRFVLSPNEDHRFWGAVSRAVRTPSRADQDLLLLASPTAGTFCVAFLPAPPFPPGTCAFAVPITTVTRIQGNRDQESEDVLSFEAGYRFIGSKSVSLDVATFYNRYENLRSIEPDFTTTGTMLPNGAILAPDVAFGNGVDGYTYGIETSGTWQVTEMWRLIANYAFIRLDADPDKDSLDTTTRAFIEGATPDHQASLRSSLDLPWDVELDTTLFYTNHLEQAAEIGSQRIRSWVGLNVRIGWHPVDDVELSLVAHNATEKRHQEFSGSVASDSSFVERSIFGKVTWDF